MYWVSEMSPGSGEISTSTVGLVLAVINISKNTYSE